MDLTLMLRLLKEGWKKLCCLMLTVQTTECTLNDASLHVCFCGEPRSLIKHFPFFSLLKENTCLNLCIVSCSESCHVGKELKILSGWLH